MNRQISAALAFGLAVPLLAATPVTAAPLVTVAAVSAPDGPITAVVDRPVSSAVLTAGDLTVDCEVAATSVTCLSPDDLWPVGRHALTVTDAEGDTTVQVVVAESYDPAVSGSQNVVWSGRDLTVDVSGWTAPDTDVAYRVEAADGREVASGPVTVDEAGAGQFVVPTELTWSGEFRVVVSDGISERVTPVELVAWDRAKVSGELSSSSVTIGDSVTVTAKGLVAHKSFPVTLVVTRDGEPVLERDVEVDSDGTIKQKIGAVATDAAGKYRVKLIVGGLADDVTVFSETLLVVKPIDPGPINPGPVDPTPVDPTPVVPEPVVPPVTSVPEPVSPEPERVAPERERPEEVYRPVTADPVDLGGAAVFPEPDQPQVDSDDDGDLVDDADEGEDLIAGDLPKVLKTKPGRATDTTENTASEPASSPWTALGLSGLVAAIVGGLWFAVAKRRRTGDTESEGVDHVS